MVGQTHQLPGSLRQLKQAQILSRRMGNARTSKRLAGHESIRTTQVDTKPEIGNLREAVELFSYE